PAPTAKTGAMTTSRSTTRSSAAPRRAFTLVEVLLVLALVVAAGAISAPLWSRSLDRTRADGAAEALRTAWSDARLEAMRRGAPLWFQPLLGTSDYQLVTLAEAHGGATPAAPGGGPPTTSQRLDGALFRELALAPPGAVEPTPVAGLAFSPDGSTQDGYAVIEAESGARRRVSLRGLTGAVTIDEVSAVEGGTQ
ncbi:MAG: GspH/FimT family pseudopilin, partial [Lacipirellulaceae bacterium]